MPGMGGATTTTRELEYHRLRPVTTGFLTHFGPLVMPGLLHGVLGRLDRVVRLEEVGATGPPAVAKLPRSHFVGGGLPSGRTSPQ